MEYTLGEASDPIIICPKKTNLAKASDRDSKIAIMNTSKNLKDNMNKCFNEDKWKQKQSLKQEENNWRYESRIYQRNRITREKLKWSKTWNEKFRKWKD